MKIDFSMINSTNKSAPFHEMLEVDISDENYVDNIANSITERANSLANKYSLETMNALSLIVMDMINAETKNLSNDKIKEIETQGLFMFYSLIQTTKRVISNRESKNKSSITSTPIEGFALGLTPFMFNEDIGINVDNFITFIDENPDFSAEKGAYVFKEVLLNLKNDNVINITAQKLYSEVNNYVEEQSKGNKASSWWPQGSDHGCCGNYSGNCWYWHPVCYVHDVMCTNCEPAWFCLSGCVPDAVAQTTLNTTTNTVSASVSSTSSTSTTVNSSVIFTL